MSTRDDIAATLAGVELDPPLDAKAHQPNTVHPYVAWPQWVRTSWVTDCATEQTWWVLVALPAGSPEVSADAVDELTAPIGDALLDLGTVDSAEPATLSLQDGGAPAPLLRFTLRTTS